MTILVTGGTGLVGSRLLPRLVRSGVQCRALVRADRPVSDGVTAVELALTGATDGRIVNIADEAPTTIYEIARIVGASYEQSAVPLATPWKGHLNGSLARTLGFQPTVATVYQASREGAL